MSDERIRELERLVAQGDPEATRHWFRMRQRGGGRDAFLAVREEREWLWQVERPRIDVAWRAAARRFDDEAMAALRALHPRIRRSRRKDYQSLLDWANEVVGLDAAQAAVMEIESRKETVYNLFRQEAQAVMDRRQELEELRLTISMQVEPKPGDQELEFRFHSTQTHSTVGYGADHYARIGAAADVAFLKHSGFATRAEQVPGEPWPESGPPRTWGIRGVGAYAWIRAGQGWRSFVKVEGPDDAEILRARQDYMKSRDWSGYFHITGSST